MCQVGRGRNPLPALPGLVGEAWRDRPCWVCGSCGRLVYTEGGTDPEELRDWLIAPRLRSSRFHHDDRVIVRCPRHIGRWALDQANLRSLNHQQWAKDARERDAVRYPLGPPDPRLQPYILPRSLIEKVLGDD